MGIISPARRDPPQDAVGDVPRISVRSGDASAAPTRVFLVEQHELLRLGIRTCLESAGIHVVGEASTAAEARRRIPAVRPDVALLSARLPDAPGIDVCRDLGSSCPQVRCIMLTAGGEEEGSLATAGAAAQVRTNVSGDALVDRVQQVAIGRSLRGGGPGRRVPKRPIAAHGGAGLARLTGRQRQVLALIADGLTNRQIGLELSLAEKTVKNYVSTVLSTLGLKSRTQAAILRLGPAGL